MAAELSSNQKKGGRKKAGVQGSAAGVVEISSQGFAEGWYL
jgi:hypothetical protein